MKETCMLLRCSLEWGGGHKDPSRQESSGGCPLDDELVAKVVSENVSVVT